MTSTGQPWSEPTLWPEATPASHLALSDTEKEQTIPDTSGLCSLNAFAWYDRATRCWRTCQGTLVSDLDMFSETWPRSGMTRNGTAYQRRPSAPITGEIASSSSLPTPTSRDYKDGTAPRIRDGRLQRDTLGRAIGGPPNPIWVEWLMGFPTEWTDLEPSGTPSSHK